MEEEKGKKEGSSKILKARPSSSHGWTSFIHACPWFPSLFLDFF